MDAKEVAARKAVEYVKDGMILGLGTGSTATFAIKAIGERVLKEGLKVRGVPTSLKSEALAQILHLPLADLSEVDRLDLTIDGADEVDENLHLLKGGGGALVREKLVAAVSREFIVICDDSKIKPKLGAFSLPIAVVPFGWHTTQQRLERFGVPVTRRETAPGSGTPFVSDDGLYVFDMQMGEIPDPPALEQELKSILGVAEVGLFTNLATRVVVGYADGRTEEKQR